MKLDLAWKRLLARRLLRSALAIASAAAFIGCAGPGAEKRPRPATTDRSGRNMDCIGRFQFSLPETLTVTGRKQTIYTVDVSTIASPPGGAMTVWNERMSRINALSPPQGVNRVVARTFQLQTGVPAVWYFRSKESPELLALEAMKALPDHVLIVNRGADLDAPERQVILQGGGQEIVERLVKNVIDAYVPAATLGFCVGYGAITSKPSKNEETRIMLGHRSLGDLKIRIETHTVTAPDTRTYSDLDEESHQAAARGGQMTVMSEAARPVAGLPGKEMRISVASPGDRPFVRFTWHFSGVPGRSD